MKEMPNTRIKQILISRSLSRRGACLCASCILLLLLETKRVEARLLWIPVHGHRVKVNTEDSANAINADNDSVVKIAER